MAPVPDAIIEISQSGGVVPDTIDPYPEPALWRQRMGFPLRRTCLWLALLVASMNLGVAAAQTARSTRVAWSSPPSPDVSPGVTS